MPTLSTAKCKMQKCALGKVQEAKRKLFGAASEGPEGSWGKGAETEAVAAACGQHECVCGWHMQLGDGWRAGAGVCG